MALRDDPSALRRRLRPDLLGRYEEIQRARGISDPFGPNTPETEFLLKQPLSDWLPAAAAQPGAPEPTSPRPPAPDGLIQRWTRKVLQGPLYDLIVPQVPEDEELDRSEVPPPAPEAGDESEDELGEDTAPAPAPEAEEDAAFDDDARGPFPPGNDFLPNEPISEEPPSGDPEPGGPEPGDENFLPRAGAPKPPESDFPHDSRRGLAKARLPGDEAPAAPPAKRAGAQPWEQQVALAPAIPVGISIARYLAPLIGAAIHHGMEEERRRERQGKASGPAGNPFTPVKPEAPVASGRPAEAMPPLRLPGFEPPVPPPPLSGFPMPDKDLVPPVQGFPNNAGRGRRPLIVAGSGIRTADPDVVPLDDLKLEQLIPPADIGGIIIHESRGGPFTQEGNAIGAKEIKEIGTKHYPSMGDRIEHTHGSYEGGKMTEGHYLKEKVYKDENRPQGVGPLWNAVRGDITVAIKDKHGNIIKEIIIQTATEDASGFVTREIDAAKKIRSHVKHATGDEPMVVLLPKLRPSDPAKGLTEKDRTAYRDMMRSDIRKVFKSVLGKPEVPFE